MISCLVSRGLIEILHFVDYILLLSWCFCEGMESGTSYSNILLSDVDPGQQDPLWLLYSSTHGPQKSCGEKGAVWMLFKLKRGPLTPAWTGFYCFSGHITLRMVLIYYAQVHHR